MTDTLNIDEWLDWEGDRDRDSTLVVLMCGIAGSGKTTFSKRLEEQGFARLSIDEEVWNMHGRYGIDYPVEKYREYLDEAHASLRTKLASFIQDKKRVVVDSSFWSRSARDDYKRLIEHWGGEWKLIYLKVHPDELRKRLKVRSHRFDANAAFPITEETLNNFLNSFEEPQGEGEIVVEHE
ncbi:putative kinase [Paenibacillus rhizosphaerae]|uniref:Putative kinase n=1 Tax=Paenibacillus rhizosphaerae TaxID=297318 RepID=A0A839TJ49_9BACL|nr:ATP-binding protein [Paenibacillus rhizosphaerae]MBB3126836.1 putative kinase [Paenibacillus rhizosphaerae]